MVETIFTLTFKTIRPTRVIFRGYSAFAITENGEVPDGPTAAGIRSLDFCRNPVVGLMSRRKTRKTAAMSSMIGASTTVLNVQPTAIVVLGNATVGLSFASVVWCTQT